MNRKQVFNLQALLVLLVILLGTLASQAQTTVTLEDQCNCEVLKGTEVTTAGAVTPAGAEAGDLYVNTDTGAIYFWDGDSWEIANVSASEWADGSFNGNELIYAKQAAAVGDTIAITDDGKILIGETDGVLELERPQGLFVEKTITTDVDGTGLLYYPAISGALVLKGDGMPNDNIYGGIRGRIVTDSLDNTNYRNFRASNGDVKLYGSGTVNLAQGAVNYARNHGTGLIINAYGTESGVQVKNDNAQITNGVAGQFNVLDNAGSIENAYGIRVGNVTAGDSLNYAIYTGTGDIRFGGIQDSIDASHSVVTQDDLGILRKQPIDSLLNGLDTTNDSWFNDPTDSRMELFTLSDGITPRDSTNRIYFTDDGKFVFGSDKPAYIEANGNTNAGFSFVNKEKWNYSDSGPFTGLYGGQLAAINLNNQSALDNQIRFGTRTILEVDSLNTSDYRQLRGVDGAVFHNGSGNILSVQGVDVTARNNGTGSINNVYGINVGYGHSPKSEGGIGNAIGLNLVVANPVDSIGRTTVNNYGIRIADVKDASNGNWAIHTRRGMVSLGDTLQLRNTVGAPLTDILATNEGIAIVDAEGNVTKRDASVLSGLSEWEDVTVNGVDAILAKQAAAVGDTLMITDDSGIFSKTQTMAGFNRDAYNKQLASSAYIPSANEIGEYDFNGFENLVDGASANTSSYYNGVLSKVYNDTLSTSPSATSPGMLGIGARVLKYGSADAQNQLIGTQGIVDSKENNTGTIPMAVGARGRVVKRGAGDVNNAIGVDAAVNLFADATGAITNTRGLFSLINNYDNSLNVVNMDGVLSHLNIRANTKGGSISNANAGNFTLTSPANGAVIENASLLKATIGGNSNASNSNIENFYGLTISNINRGQVSNHAIYTNAGKVSLGDTLQLRNTVGAPLTDMLAADEGIAVVDAEGNVTKREASVLADALSDADFFVAGTTDTPQDITDNIYTLGNVGIGTNNPTSRLDVVGPRGLYLNHNGNSSSGFGFISSPNNMHIGQNAYFDGGWKALGNSTGKAVMNVTSLATDIAFRTLVNDSGTLVADDPITWTSVFTVGTNGNLRAHGDIMASDGFTSVGTERNPVVTVFSDRAFGMELHSGQAGSGHSAGWATAVYGRNSGATSLRFGSYNGNVTAQEDFIEMMTLQNDGDFGIGIIDPTEKLDIDGTVRLRGLVDDNAATKMVVADTNGVLKTQDLGAVVSSAPIRTETTDYTVVDGDVSILVDASSNAVTVTLPVPSEGRVVRIKKIDTTTNNLVINGAGATIDGAPNRTTTVPYQSFLVQSDGTNWFIMN